MQFASGGYHPRRNPAGFVVTVALHAGLVAAVLFGLGIVEMKPQKPVPIAVRDYDAPQTPALPLLEPRTTDQKIEAVVPIPAFDQIDAPQVDRSITATTSFVEPGRTGPVIGLGDPVVEPLPPTGVTRSAKLDPRYARDFEAPYPSASQRLGEAGTVVIRVVVGPDGRVLRASIARSSGFERLDAAALQRALAKWRFLPALLDGVAVEAEREVPVTFFLREG